MESALQEAGTCGRFQVCHVVFTQLPRFVAVWGIMIMMFGNYDPGWRCKGPNWYQEHSRNYSVSNGSAGGNGDGDGVGSVDSDTLYKRSNGTFNLRDIPAGLRYGGASIQDGASNHSDWRKLGNRSFDFNGTRRRHFYNEACDVMDYCDDIEFNPGSITIVSEFQLVCDRKWILRIILLVMSTGFLTGALAGGQVGEKFGRKVSLYGGCLMMFVFSGLAIFSHHWIMYMICLFLIGAGGNFIQSTSSIFCMEFLNSKWRSIFGSIPVWNISLCIFTFSAVMMKSWVHVHIVTCVLSLAAFVGYFVLPESLRWLVVHGKYEEAEKVIQKVARINKRQAPTSETFSKLKNESECNSEKKTIKRSSSSSSSSSSTTYTYLHLFKNNELSLLTIKFTTIFLMIFATYFALSFGINSLPGDFYVNAVASSVCEMSVVVVTGPLCNKIGRRWGGFVVSVLGVISCTGIVVSLYAAEGEVQSTTIKTFAFLARGGSMAKSTVATLFMAELYPTAVRNVAFGMFRAMAGVGGLIGPFLIPNPTKDSFAICFSIMAGGFLLSLFIFLSFSETNKLCLVDRIDNSNNKRAAESECV